MFKLFKQPLFYLFLAFSFIFTVAIHPVPYLTMPDYVYFFGIFILAIGIIILIDCLTLFIKKQIQCGFDNTIDFVAEGIYLYSRNPDYISLLFILTGTALMSLNGLALLAPLTFYYLCNHWFIPQEEYEMIRDYGAEYANFQNKVKRWI